MVGGVLPAVIGEGRGAIGLLVVGKGRGDTVTVTVWVNGQLHFSVVVGAAGRYEIDAEDDAETMDVHGVVEPDEDPTGARTDDDGPARYFVEVLYSENVKVTVVVRPENVSVVLRMVTDIGGAAVVITTVGGTTS
jgi:hypothetical protein